MVAKAKNYYVCSECGADYVRWQGQCENCQNWNTLKEFAVPQTAARSSILSTEAVKPALIDASLHKNIPQIPTQNSEFDRVLGGGIVPGSVILLAGSPGIGKSTLLLKLALDIKKTLYVSGEESANQIALRLRRLNQKAQLNFLAATDIDQVINAAQAASADLLIVDSIQTMYDVNYPSTPGSIVQVRETALKLQQFAKLTGVACLLVGHVTKDGAIAGPKILEHMVDVVAYLEGERRHDIRLLRATKNRFGATNEVGVLQMTLKGLTVVANPSELFLAERLNAPGSAVTATLEGTRPLLVEIQALTAHSWLPAPRRVANGFSKRRLDLILAVLARRVGLKISQSDVFVNVVGGFLVHEPAADAAVAAALASSFVGKALDPQLALAGEVGLSGEIRSVTDWPKRQNEAQRLGFKLVGRERTLKQLIEKYIR